MSSLRISHHSRAIGEAASGGAEAHKDVAGESFASALDAAGLAPKDAAAALLGGASGDTGDSSQQQRKLADGQRKTEDAAASAAAAGLVTIAAPVDLPAATNTGVTAGVTDLDDNGSDQRTIDALDLARLGSTAAATDTSPLSTSVASAAPQSGITFAWPSRDLIPTLPSAANLRSSEPPSSLAISRPSTKATSVQTVAADVTSFAPSIIPATQPLSSGQTGSLPVHVPRANTSVSDPSSATAAAASIDASSQASTATTNAQTPSIALTLAPKLANLGQALSIAAPGKAGATLDDDASVPIDRDRFATVAAAPQNSDATAATALAGPGDTPALAVPATAGPVSGADPTAAATVADQVAGHLVRMVSSNSREMVMRLHPPDLGDLTVRVAVNGRDVTAWFASPQPQVQTAISDALGQLQAGLGDAGYNLSGAWVGGDGAGARQPATNLPAPQLRAPAQAPSLGLTGAVGPRSSTSAVNIYV
jgi:flagellar hook-length control protein FliK